jgi:hypothetical protein
MVIKFTKTNKNPKVIMRTKITWKFWKTIEKFKWWIWVKPMVELTNILDRNYQSLNLNHANRQSIPRFDLPITTKYLKIYQNVWTWIGLRGLQKGGSKKLKKLSKSPNTYRLQNLMARDFKSWEKNPSYLNWASKGLHKVEVKNLKEHKTLSLNQPNSGTHKVATQLMIQHLACQVVVPWRCSKIGATH